jgi:hypothetical protein
MVATHAVTAPRIAFMHTWLATQTEGWWRYAFDTSRRALRLHQHPDRRQRSRPPRKYDVIVFAPSAAPQFARHPRRHAHVEQRHALAENRPHAQPRPLDSTPTCAPASATTASPTSRSFVEQGGLLITCEDTAQFAIDTGLAPGVSVRLWRRPRRRHGAQHRLRRRDNPVAFGYGARACPSSAPDGMAFNVSNTLGRGGGRVLMDPYAEAPHRPRQRRRQRRAAGPQNRRSRAARQAAALGAAKTERRADPQQPAASSPPNCALT